VPSRHSPVAPSGAPPAGVQPVPVRKPILKTRSGRRVQLPVRFAEYVAS